MECVLKNVVKTCAPGVSKISLAWLPIEKFEDDEYDFLFLGHLVGPSSDIPHFNVHGTPWYVNTDDGTEYLNLLYADEVFTYSEDKGWRNTDDGARISRARAPLISVIKDAKKGKIGRWQKNFNGEWSQDLKKPANAFL